MTLATPFAIAAPDACRARARVPDETRREIGRLRRVAQRSQIAPRLDLDRLAAEPDATDPALWGVALLQAVARGRPITFHRRAGADATRCECWMGMLLSALRAGDGASARFLVERHVRKDDRRLALCFAQRLVAADAAPAESRPLDAHGAPATV